MISTHIRKAINALLIVDEAATEEDRNRLTVALAGEVRLWSKTEAAARLGVSRPTLDKHIRRGLITTTATGKISEVEVERLLSARRKGDAA